MAEISNTSRKKIELRSLTPFLGIVFVYGVFAILTGGNMLKFSNLEVIISQAFTLCVLGIGAMFVFSHGGLDFSIGSAMGMCSVFIARIILSGQSPLLALLVSVLFGAFSGFLVGATSEFLGLTPFIASLCYSYIWRGVVQVALGYDNIYMPPAFCAAYTNWTLKAVLLLAMFIIALVLFNRTRIGKFQKAIGCSPVVAKLSGVPVKKHVILSHMILGVCVGIAALFSAARSAQVYPMTGQGNDMDVLVACVLGGMPLGGGNGCSMLSVALGSLTVVGLSNGLTQIGVRPTIIDGITGAIFIAVVALSYRRSKGQAIK